MNPEAADAIRIADKHLRGASVERRKALATDIHEAIIRHADLIAVSVIKQGIEIARQRRDQ